MKSHVLKWGLISSLFMFITPLLTFFAFGEEENYDLGEIIGWTLISLALVFIVLGIRSYRAENSGAITFGKALKLGLLISLFPAVAFVVYNWMYINYLDPDFTEKYYTHKMDQAKDEMSAENYVLYAKKMEAEKEMFTSPVMQAIVYFFTIYILGFMVSIISAWLMKRKYQTDTPVT